VCIPLIYCIGIRISGTHKEFDAWLVAKKKIHHVRSGAFAHPREIWWCSLGINIGAETDGKNENFERPILVFKVYNTETMLVFPITSKQKDDPFHFTIKSQLLKKPFGLS